MKTPILIGLLCALAFPAAACGTVTGEADSSTGYEEFTVNGVTIRLNVDVTVTKPPTVPAVPPPVIVPAPPMDLAAEVLTQASGTRYVKLAWKDVSTAELAFVIWRRSGDGPWVVVGAVPQNGISFTDWGARAAGTAYQFKVQGMGLSGASTESASVEALLP